jgi:hypothetical protein
LNNHSTVDEKSKKRPSWLILFLRWLLGGAIGFGLSAWICLGYITNNTTGLLSFILDNFIITTILFTGPLLLFDPSFYGNDSFIDFLVRSFPNADYDFLVISLPSMIWGFIGALLASGSKEQTRVGRILLVAYIILGCISYIRLFIAIFRFF